MSTYGVLLRRRDLVVLAEAGVEVRGQDVIIVRLDGVGAHTGVGVLEAGAGARDHALLEVRGQRVVVWAHTQ